MPWGAQPAHFIPLLRIAVLQHEEKREKREFIIPNCIIPNLIPPPPLPSGTLSIQHQSECLWPALQTLPSLTARGSARSSARGTARDLARDSARAHSVLAVTQDPILDHYEADLDLTYYPSNEFGLFEPEQQSFGHSNNPNTSLIWLQTPIKVLKMDNEYYKIITKPVNLIRTISFLLSDPFLTTIEIVIIDSLISDIIKWRKIACDEIILIKKQLI